MNDIFISYKHEEQPRARMLADALQKKGWSVWWDTNLRAGEHFDDAIEKALNNAKCVIVMWSKLSVNSRYVKDEAAYALERKKLVPIAIEKVDLPLRFGSVQAGQLIDWDGSDSFPGYQKLVADIENILGSPQVEIEEKERKEAAKRKAEKDLKRKDSDIEGKSKEEQERTVVVQRTTKETKTFTNHIGMEFVLISAGSFTMGSGPAGQDSERPSHTVEISRPFYLQKTEVTQGQWKEVMGDNPSHFSPTLLLKPADETMAEVPEKNKPCDDCPVESVSWEDAHKFINMLNDMEGVEAYRLPTEAEWEYAVRAGTTSWFSFGADKNKLTDYAWFELNSDGKTHPVGQKKPNPWGLYDMHGNVFEWVEDDWHGDYEDAPKDGRAWIDKPRRSARVVRGGGWLRGARLCRSACRSDLQPGYPYDHVGFRLARSVSLGP